MYSIYTYSNLSPHDKRDTGSWRADMTNGMGTELAECSQNDFNKPTSGNPSPSLGRACDDWFQGDDCAWEANAVHHSQLQ